MKKLIKKSILKMCSIFEMTPYNVVDCVIKAFAFATITAFSIRPLCWAMVKIAELIGRI